jgi:Dolichyl-phosphate-mannose-protein mannosyltransferase
VRSARWSLAGLPARYPVVLACLLLLAFLHQGSVLASVRANRDFDHIFSRWLISLAAAGLGLAAWDRWCGRSLTNPLSRGEWLGCAALTVAGLALYAFDLGSYRYSFIGDEFSFFSVARDLDRGSLRWDNVFLEDGVWGYHPRLASLYQAAVMSVFGIDNFGWRFSSVLAATASFLPCFILLKHAIGARAAGIGTLLLALSHYSMAFAHIGYDNNHVLFPTLLCFALLFWSTASASGLGFFASGVAAGLGFYTFYTSRLAVAFAAVYFAFELLRGHRRRWLACIAFFALGFLLSAGPTLAWPARLLDNMQQQSVLASAGLAPETLRSCRFCPTQAQGELMKANAARALASPVYFHLNSHFVSGTIVDPLTAALFVVGVWVALGRLRRATVYPFLLIFYLLSALVLGLSTPYDTLPATRMLFMILPTVLLATVGADFLWSRGLASGHRRLTMAGVVLSAATVGFLNLHRLYVETPRANGIASQALALRYLQQAPAGGRYFYLLPDDWGAELIRLHFDMYGLGGKVEVLHFAELRADPTLLRAPCEVLFNQDSPEARQGLIGWLRARYSRAAVSRIAGPGGKNEILVLALQ